jgi:uncharacterized RmlC-like cupin family protein
MLQQRSFVPAAAPAFSQGTARIASGDKTFDAAPGTAVTLSKGVPHARCNLSGSPRMAVIASPGGIEEILPLIAKEGDVDIISH